MTKKKSDRSNYTRDAENSVYKLKPTKLELGKSLKGFIYVRVSDKKQVEEGNGLDNQIMSCEEHARKQGIEIVNIYQDGGVSGRLSSREGFDKMIEDLKVTNKKDVVIDFIIVSEYSRFSRNVKLGTSEQMEDEIKNTGCNLMIVRNNLSTGDKASQLQFDNEKIKAKYESEENRERTIDRMTGRLRGGYYVFAAPAGYEYEKVSLGHKKTQSYIYTIPEYANIIKQALEGYADGVFQTNAQILKFLNEKNLKSNHHTPNIGKLQATFVSRLFDIDRLYFYAGFIIYPKYGILEPIKAKHEAIISYDTLYRIMNKLKQRGKGKYGYRADASELYPLRGLIFCPHCNNPLTASGSSGNGGTYHYYLCNRAVCTSKFNVPVKKIHDEFIEFLKTIKPQDEIIALLDEIYNEKIQLAKQDKESGKRALTREIQKIENQTNIILESIGKLSNLAMIKKLEDDRGTLNQRKIDLEEQLNNEFLTEIEIKDLYEKLKTIVSNPVAIREIGNKEMKNMLISVLFGGKIYYEKKLGFQTNENQVLIRDSPMSMYFFFSNGAVCDTYLKPNGDLNNLYSELSCKLLLFKSRIYQFYNLVNHQVKFYPLIESFFAKHLLAP